MATGEIARADNLFDFFHTSVGVAAARQGAQVSEDSLYYLSNLLVERGRVRDVGEQPDTLVGLVEKAQQSSWTQAVSIWRELADRALYVTGFFRDSLTRRMAGLNYYMEMGSGAYQRLARLLHSPGEGRGLDAVFAELGEHFPACSDLLAEVREDVTTGEEASDMEILRLYETWLATGSPRAAARLQELGVVPARPGRGSGEG